MKNNMKENFRRLWPIVLVWTILDVLAGPVAVMLSPNNGGRFAVLQDSFILGIGTFFSIAINCVFTIIAGVAVFRYAHNQQAATVMHALPIRRWSLFVSNSLSGLVILAVPQFVSSSIMLTLVKPGFGHLFLTQAARESVPGATTDMGDILRAFILMLVACIFVYALTLLSGMVTGTAVIHLLTAGFANIVLPSLYFLTMYLFRIFFYGFYDVNQGFSVGSILHPLLMFADVPASVTFLSALIYLLISIAIIAVAMLLYIKLKTERIGSAFTNDTSEMVFVVLVTLLGMIICALLMSGGLSFFNYGSFVSTSEMVKTRIIFYVGAFLGAAVTFLIATMVARKTPRVFDIASLKNFGICLVCGIVFLVFTTTDATGFEKRVPSPSTVGSASITLGQYNIVPYKWNYDLPTIKLTGKEGIQRITALHSAIVESNRKYAPDEDAVTTYGESLIINEDEKSQVYTPFTHFDGVHGTLNINYDLGTSKDMTRCYTLDQGVILTKQFRDLIESAAFKKASTIDTLYGYDRLSNMMITSYYATEYEAKNFGFDKNLKPSEIEELAMQLDSDYKKLSAVDMLEQRESEILTFCFGFGTPVQGEKWYYAESMIYSVTDKYEGTIEWLKKKGYYEDMLKATEKMRAKMEKGYS